MTSVREEEANSERGGGKGARMKKYSIRIFPLFIFGNRKIDGKTQEDFV